MSTLKFQFLVTIEVQDTDGLLADDKDSSYGNGYCPTSSNARNYIRDAVTGWGGQFHLNDPFFRPKRVTVKAVPKFKTASLPFSRD